MTDTPERIWAWLNETVDRDNMPITRTGWDDTNYDAKWYADRGIPLTEYIRKDATFTADDLRRAWEMGRDDAAAEAAGEVAAHGASELGPFIRRAIRVLTPPADLAKLLGAK